MLQRLCVIVFLGCGVTFPGCTSPDVVQPPPEPVAAIEEVPPPEAVEPEPGGEPELPELKAITGSIFQAAGYDANRQVMCLQFIQGAVYRFGEVPEKVYQGLLASDNQSAYFKEHINEKYPTVWVRDVPTE